MKKPPHVLCGILALLLTGCSAAPDAEIMDPIVAVEVTAVQMDTLRSDSTYIGTVSAEGTASVVTMISGTVEEVFVSVGDTVNAGSALCRFDDESARLSLESARASQRSAQSSLDSAQESYRSAAANYGGESLSLLEEQVRMAQEHRDATQALYEMGAAALLEVEQAEQALHSAQAGLEAARASLNSAQAGLGTAQSGVQSAAVGVASAEYQLSLYHLSSPVSGVVEAVHVSANNFAPSGTAAFVISNARNKTVTFYVTDTVRRNMTIGQPVEVSVQDTLYSGTVSEIGGIVDVSTSMFQIKAIIEDAQDLPDGLSVSVTTASNTREDAILVPSDALYFDNGIAYVYRVEDGAAVRTDLGNDLLYTQEWTAVPSGLQAGDEIITSWSSRLKDGVPVQVLERQPQGGEAE